MSIIGGDEGFRRRLGLIMDQFGSVADLARAVGVSDNAIYKWVAGRGQPNMASLVNLARAAGVSVEWLATGISPPVPIATAAATAPPDPAADLIPAGSTALIADYLHFDPNWLRQRFPDADPARLLLIEVEGDAMAPTLGDGDAALIDTRQSRFRHDGLYALEAGQTLVIRRLQREPDGRIAILSDNRAYPPRHAAPADLRIVGRLLWRGGPP